MSLSTRPGNEPDATALSAAVRGGEVSAAELAEGTLERIARLDPALNCFTTVTAERLRSGAARVDAAVARGEDSGPLAGVPFGVKNLYDVAGLTTLAGSTILRDTPPATEDAPAVAALDQAGATLAGALNMDEFAYGFVTENAHYGSTRNPHDPSRTAGGSSGGSAAAVAAGILPLALGSDTNGSVRVPAALCGIFGLRPTYGRLSRAGTFPFVASLDTIGPFARSVRDLALVFDLLQGADGRGDPVLTKHAPEPTLPTLDAGCADLRIAVADGFFEENAEPVALAAVTSAASALGVTRHIGLPEAGLARAAAFLLSAAEGGELHLERLRTRAAEFDPATRDRLLAGALVPAAWVERAQRFRAWFRDAMRRVFQEVDVLLTPATPCVAPLLGQAKMTIGGREVPVRATLGLFTQPFSLVGLPALTAPVFPDGADGLPVGVQIVAASFQEAAALRVARVLERNGVAVALVANPKPQ